MKLNVPERLSLLQVLPQEGNVVTLKILKDLASVLGLSEEEFKEFGIKRDGDQATWNEKGGEEIEIALGEMATDIITETLVKLDRNNKLPQRCLSSYEKFVEKKE